MKSLLPALAASLLLVGCASQTLAPGNYKDREDMDELAVIQTFHLSAYNRILVLPIDYAAVEIPTDSGRSAVTEILKDSTAHVAEKLGRKLPGKFKRTVVVAPSNAVLTGNPGTLILRAKFTEMDPGSYAGRLYSAGIGGKTKITLAGDLIDGGTGQVLARFAKRNTHGELGLLNMNSRNLEENEDEIIESVSNLIEAFNP